MEDTRTNPKYKDRLFSFIFGNEKNKKWTLALYNAVNHSSYTNPDDIEINTLENAVYMGMKNDVSFLLHTAINLYEHQSTYNPNMPDTFSIKEFLLENRAEVEMSCLTEYNEAETMNMLKEEAWEEGLAEGREEGRKIGLAEGRAEGRAEGLKQGLEKGRLEGEQNGYRMSVQNVALCLMSKDASLSEEDALKEATRMVMGEKRN